MRYRTIRVESMSAAYIFVTRGRHTLHYVFCITFLLLDALLSAVEKVLSKPLIVTFIIVIIPLFSWISI